MRLRPTTRMPIVAGILIGVFGFTIAAAQQIAPPPSGLSKNEQILWSIRRQFRSHRPPPAYVTYTLERKQLRSDGFPDMAESYKYHIWCRSVDRAALARKFFRLGGNGPLEFKRAMFNIADDPGPPTADVFEAAPPRGTSSAFVPTPEPNGTPLPVIGTVKAAGEFDYRVTSVDMRGGLIHVILQPRRDPDRNRLREIYADAKTYEIHKLVATDKLFVQGGPVYPVIFTITLGWLQGRPVITNAHGDVGGGYYGDGQQVDFTFTHIQFPDTLPSWYFDPRSYASHQNDAPV